MITEKLPYRDINHTLQALKVQVIDSLDYARTLPTFDHPETLFYYLKKRTRYKNDPHDIELLQTLQTLLEKNRGRGDCDCFVIATLSLCWVQGKDWQKLFVYLAGRDKSMPVHIWTAIDFDGQFYDMDLTQPVFDSTRKYKYLQKLNFKI